MELLEKLELVEVQYDGKKAILRFLDEVRGEVREVTFNKQSYDNDRGEFVDDPEKEEKVAKWCQDIFGLTFERLNEAIGERRDVYAYDTFNSLFEVEQIAKFDKNMVGQIMEVVVTNAFDDGKAIRIQFGYEGKTYESKMGYADYIESKKQWFVNPQKKAKQYEKFEDKFGFGIDECAELIGQTVLIEIKLAFKKFVYIEIKPFAKKK